MCIDLWTQACRRIKLYPLAEQPSRLAHSDCVLIISVAHSHCLQVGCDFDAVDLAALEAHHERDHFRCDGCKLIYPSQTKLHQHQEDCNLPVPCPYCGEPCAGQGGLARHLKQCFACDKCGFYTPHEGNLRIVSSLGRLLFLGAFTDHGAAYDEAHIRCDSLLGLQPSHAYVLEPHQSPRIRRLPQVL